MQTEPLGAADLRLGLEKLAGAFRHLAPTSAAILYDFVLREGIDCTAQPLPKGFTRGQPGACFYNASRLVKRRKALRYVEGYVATPRVPFPMHHGWAIDAADRVIDPTLPEPERSVYRGIVIPRDDLMQLTRRGDSASAFLTEVGTVRLEYVLSRCASLRTQLSPVPA